MWEIRGWVAKTPLWRKKAARRKSFAAGKRRPAGTLRASRIARSRQD